MNATLSRLTLVDPATATGPIKTILDGVQKQMGGVPNFLRALAPSPAALEAFLGLNSKLAQGSLDRQIGERIALVTAETNGCQYCVSAHTELAGKAGLDESEIKAARRGVSSDPKAAAAVAFTVAVLANKGDVTSGELDALRTAGFNDGEIAEIITHIGLNTLTNYLGKIGQIDIDWPEVALLGSDD